MKLSVPVAGRVKTLHPGVHGGILALRDKQEHMSALGDHGISTIDVVCVCFVAGNAAAQMQGAGWHLFTVRGP